MCDVPTAAAYARYSTDLQTENSIASNECD